MVLNYTAEKEYIFDHSCEQFREKLIFPDLGGVDWDLYRTAYRRSLPYIKQQLRFRRDASEMLGEMNVSHTGAYYNPQVSAGRSDRIAWECCTTILIPATV
jgi:hypothetical protein